jgi:hypothetical protein
LLAQLVDLRGGGLMTLRGFGNLTLELLLFGLAFGLLS